MPPLGTLFSLLSTHPTSLTELVCGHENLKIHEAKPDRIEKRGLQVRDQPGQLGKILPQSKI